MFYKTQAVIFLVFCLHLVYLTAANGFDLKVLREPSNSDPRIINGTEARWNGTRHQVSVRLKTNDWFFGGGHICGGSLIKPSVVLTAGHCIWNYDKNVLRTAEEFSVVMGNTNRLLKDENVRIYDVLNISMLPTFNVTTFVDDVALLFLNDSVPKNYTRVHAIALNDKLNFTSNKCEVSGWGVMETGQTASELMVVDVPIVNHTACRSIYGEGLKNGMLCAGYMEGERDACQGDSGGPLVCNDLLVGVVSWGYGCALPQLPGVYADVAYYVPWIRNQTGGGSNALKAWNLFGLFLVLVVLKLVSME